jgi:hypothetical protein
MAGAKAERYRLMTIQLNRNESSRRRMCRSNSIAQIEQPASNLANEKIRSRWTDHLENPTLICLVHRSEVAGEFFAGAGGEGFEDRLRGAERYEVDRAVGH